MGKRDYDDEELDALGNGTYRECDESDQLTKPRSLVGDEDRPEVDTSTWDDNNLKKDKRGKGKGGVGASKTTFGSLPGDFHKRKKRSCCGLSRRGVALLTVLIFVILALAGVVVYLALQVVWRRTLDLDRTCLEPECLRASAMVRFPIFFF
jgi:hypothetical protein